jgi:glycine/D-amino acid oxidase-like deaminating enzyme
MSRTPLDERPGFSGVAYDWTAPAAPITVALEGSHRADLAIVGAGITGLSAALHAAWGGARVVVAEAQEIGWGASGRSFGQVVPYLRQEPAHALRLFGKEQGERLVMAAACGPDLVFDLIAKLGINCEAQSNGLLFAAHTPQAAQALHGRVAFWSDRMAGPEWLDADAIAAAIGGGRYWGGVMEKRGGTINSLAFARGLAAACQREGSHIFTRSRVTGLERRKGEWRLATATGEIIADAVILCTNAYTDGLWPGLAQEIVPVRGYQLVSQPLTEDVWNAVLPGGQALTDTRRLMSGVRKIAGRRIQTSGGIGMFGPERVPRTLSATRRIGAVFPALKTIRWETHWSGFIAMTADEYPRLHELGRGLFAGLGCSGRGLALGTVMGRDLALLATGVREGLCLPISPMQPFSAPFATRVVASMLARFFWGQDRLDALLWGGGPKATGRA